MRVRVAYGWAKKKQNLEMGGSGPRWSKAGATVVVTAEHDFADGDGSGFALVGGDGERRSGADELGGAGDAPGTVVEFDEGDGAATGSGHVFILWRWWLTP